jgi:hypothetical protein
METQFGFAASDGFPPLAGPAGDDPDFSFGSLSPCPCSPVYSQCPTPFLHSTYFQSFPGGFVCVDIARWIEEKTASVIIAIIKITNVIFLSI